jgi:type IV secretory pathway VirB2 component (pilin)
MPAFDSPRLDALTSAVSWLEGTLLGTVATTIAIIAVGSVGFLFLSGRIDVRRAAQVVFGCFVIFGASTIANGILSAFSGTGTSVDLAQAPLPPPRLQRPPPPPPQQVNSSPFDPYAGAALPSR